MPHSDVTIKPFTWQSAADAEFEALTRFTNAIEAERRPGDPPRTLRDIASRWRSTPSFMQNEAWLAWNPAGNAIVGLGRATFRHGEGNQHLVECDLLVLPAWRRQGLGTKLLAHVVEMPRRDQRRLMLFWTYNSVPSGGEFMQHIGAQRGLVERHSQLDIATLDRAMMQEWIARAPARAAGFELVCWDGPIPEAELPAVVKVFEAMNDAPRQDLELEDDHLSPDEIRGFESSMAARGIERWLMVARETITGEYAGFTEVFWNADRAAILQQGGTGVSSQYRNRGLGRWLKAAMLVRVLHERPQVRLVRTDNANTNAAMLSINVQLGFKPFMEVTAWQIETGKVVSPLGQ